MGYKLLQYVRRPGGGKASFAHAPDRPDSRQFNSLQILCNAQKCRKCNKVYLNYLFHCQYADIISHFKNSLESNKIKIRVTISVDELFLYCFSFNRVAICLLVLHYFSEVIFHIARLIDFIDKEEKGSKGMILCKLILRPSI